MNNPFADYIFAEKMRLSQASDEDLATEYKVAKAIAEKTSLASNWRLLEIVEDEINHRNRTRH